MLNGAIIGCGRISHNHVKAFVENRNEIKLIALCDPIINKAREKANSYIGFIDKQFERESLNVYKEYKEMILDKNIDVVSICTESGSHAQIAIDCMEAGKHVIVEKPMALSTLDADRMIKVASKNGVKLCVCHQNRFNPPIKKLKQAIDEGRFGKLIAGNARILWNRDSKYYLQAPWRGTYKQDGGCLMNQCIHNIDLLQWMLGGNVKWLDAVVKNFTHDYIEAEDYGSIHMEFENGAIGNVEGTVCVHPRNWEETLSIIGENGTASIGGMAVNKVELWDFKDGLDDCEQIIKQCNQEVENVYGKGHSALYVDMVTAIKENRRPFIDGHDGKIAMEIILAAYKSSHIKKRVEFPIDAICSTDFNEL